MKSQYSISEQCGTPGFIFNFRFSKDTVENKNKNANLIIKSAFGRNCQSSIQSLSRHINTMLQASHNLLHKFLYIHGPEWLHRQCIVLAFQRLHIRG